MRNSISNFHGSQHSLQVLFTEKNQEIFKSPNWQEGIFYFWQWFGILSDRDIEEDTYIQRCNMRHEVSPQTLRLQYHL